LKKANIACGLVGMAFSAFAFIQTLGFKKFPLVPVGPEFFPRYLAAGLFICSAILIIQALVTKPRKEEKAPTMSPFDKGMLRLFIGIAIIVLYAVLWEPVGFLIVTPLAMVAIMLLCGYRRYSMMVIFSLGTTLVVFGAFSFFLNVNMPLGILWFLM